MQLVSKAADAIAEGDIVERSKPSYTVYAKFLFFVKGYNVYPEIGFHMVGLSGFLFGILYLV
jgi:hypothetical protein